MAIYPSEIELEFSLQYPELRDAIVLPSEHSPNAQPTTRSTSTHQASKYKSHSKPPPSSEAIPTSAPIIRKSCTPARPTATADFDLESYLSRIDLRHEMTEHLIAAVELQCPAEMSISRPDSGVEPQQPGRSQTKSKL